VVFGIRVFSLRFQRSATSSAASSERLPHKGAEDVALAVLEVLVVLRMLAVLRVCLPLHAALEM